MRRDHSRCWIFALALVVVALSAATVAQHFALQGQADTIAQLDYDLQETRDLIARGGAIALGLWSVQYDPDWGEKMAADLAKLEAAHAEP